METDKTSLMDLARGAAFLGAGGGGDPYIGRLMLQQELESGGSLDLVDVVSVPDDALVVPVATMGAPTVMTERIPSSDATIRAVRKLEELKGQTVDYIVPAEAGGINCTLPLVIGSRMGLPVIDGDGMGRAFPELQMVTFAIHGVPTSPVVLASEEGDLVVVHGSNNLRAEQISRVVVTEMGGMAQIGLYAMSGRELKESAIAGTVSLARRIGAEIRSARERHQDPFESLISFLRKPDVQRWAQVIFDGKIVDLKRETTRGFSVGTVIIDSMGSAKERCEIQFQNEFLVARTGTRTLTIVPDIISILDRETAEPITTDGLKYGQRVKVLGMSVPPIMRTEAALATFGPGVFGLQEEYVPIEKLTQSCNESI